MKIGIIIPSTSNGRDWEDIKESYLFKHTIRTFLLTYDKEHNYTFYIGIDKNDKIYDKIESINYIKQFISLITNVEIDFIYMDNIPKGHLTKMWNKLFDVAYTNKCDYFFQCGDDIEFLTNGWVNTCINKSVENDNIGVTGPIDINNTKLLTQSFVSRKHMELFGYYFPPEIINWYCDDWINQIYIRIHKFYPLSMYKCNNVGGNPRYNINNTTNNDLKNSCNKMSALCKNLVERDYQTIKNII